MNSLAPRITTLANRHAVIADGTAKLKAQLFELECLRERLSQALAAKRFLRAKQLSQPNRWDGRGDDHFSEM